ncbi:MAG: hypothetical protein IMZ60_05260 [Actinobacteria bacterium]|nr:hypothetical protein [Actinomycetota bacterium]
MSKAKKLKLTIQELTKIAQAINGNTITNKSRSQEEKIYTDTFIKQFGINRNDFSETIKNTNINYNKSTFQYDFDNSNNKSDTLVIPIKYKESETIVVKNETLEMNVAITEFESMKSGLVEMLEWYKSQRKNENIIEVEIPKILIYKERLSERAVTRGFKIYPNVVAEFKEFCKHNKQYTMQDLMAMAIIEYMIKYEN